MARFDVDTGWDTEFLTDFLAENVNITNGLGSVDNTRLMLDPQPPGEGYPQYSKVTAHFTVLQYNLSTNTTTALRMTHHSHDDTDVYALTMLTANGNRVNDPDLSNFAEQSRVYVPSVIWHFMTQHRGRTDDMLLECYPNDYHPLVSEDPEYSTTLALYADTRR